MFAYQDGLPRYAKVLLQGYGHGSAELYGCQLASEMMGLKKDDFVPQVREIITAMDFFEKSQGAALLFI